MYKTLMIGALSIIGFAAQAQAADTTPAAQYRYGMELDIATIVSQTGPAPVCDITPVTIIYLDSKGARHTLEYSVFGNGPGCSG